MKRQMSAAALVLILVGTPAAQAAAEEKLDGYAEWRKNGALVVDGQRVRPAPGMKFKGKGEAHDFGSIPLGYEVKAKGDRRSDGTLLAQELEAKPNGDAFFESDLREAFDQTESEWRDRGKVFEEDDDGNVETIGKLYTRGRQVDRVRGILNDLMPPYLDPEDFRIYVVENKEWNAFAAPNGSIWVFTGLLRDLDDDEVAIVLGHELVHATHEHSRKAFKKQIPWLIGTMIVTGAAEAIDSKAGKTAVQVGAFLIFSAVNAGYGRGQEDQADRTGMRYAYEAGYDVRKGPELWRKFAEKYGDENKVVNFFFSDHAQSSARAAKLDQEMALNYDDRRDQPLTARNSRTRTLPAGPDVEEGGDEGPRTASGKVPARQDVPVAAAQGKTPWTDESWHAVAYKARALTGANGPEHNSMSGSVSTRAAAGPRRWLRGEP